MLEIDDSLFSVLRVITVMISVDGSVHAAELGWFRRLLARFELSANQKKILEEDLKTPPDPGALIRNIHILDREQLLSWLRVAMNIDGKMTEREQKFFDMIKPSLESQDFSLQDSHRAVALGIIEHTKNIHNWQQIKEAGDYYQQRPYFWWGFFLWPIWAFPFRNRYVLWIFFGFIVVPAIINFIFYLTR